MKPTDTPTSEEWKPIQNYEGMYTVSNQGRVYSLTRRVRSRYGGTRSVAERILSPRVSDRGYLFVNLCREGIAKPHAVHRLVVTAFVGLPPTPRHTTNHINGIKCDNHASNLEWLTLSENQRHAFALGLNSQVGEKHSCAKLTERLVREIRQLYAGGNRTQKDLGKGFGVAERTISDLLAHRTWPHVA